MKTWLHSIKKQTILLFACVLFMGLTPSVLAEDNIDEWNMGETKDTKKVWTIEFNEPIKYSKVNSTTVYVKDEDNKKIPTKATLSSDKKSITVERKGHYEVGKVYKLYLDDSIRSESDKDLHETVVFPFTVLDEKEPKGEEDPKEVEGQPKEEEISSVTDVDFSLTSYATIVSLLTDDSVATVKVDSKEMHYVGNNRYSIGMVGLETGDSVEIQAYDGSGKVLLVKEYTVN